jgi:serine/threonine-protein kinase
MARTCPTCGVVNRDDARFCSSCATPFVQEVVCPSCGTRNVPTARFCHQCATSLTGVSPRVSPGTGLISPYTMLAGRYLIIQKIGQGGMGAVYKAADTRLGHKVVAIKEMSDAAITDPLEKQQARQAFEQEAQMLARLNHPNLPRVTDHFSEGGKQYLVMDFIEGHTLEEILNQTPGFLSEKQVVDWGTQLCDVLDYLHRQQPPVIFRDLKPGNIMLDQDGKVKLIDFGIARLFKPGKTSDTIAFGTAGYAPPEQYGKGQTDARSDVYALGATLHHLLTRREPAVDPFNFPPVRSLNLSVSAAVGQAIVRAVNQTPNQRWQSATEMRRALVTPSAPGPQVASTPTTAGGAVAVAPPPAVVAPPPVQAPTGPVLMTAGGEVLDLANFGRRACAFVLDLFVLSLLLSMTAAITGHDQGVMAIIDLALVGLYWVWPVSRWGQTPGKRILGLQVVTQAGRAPGFGRALWRAVLQGVSLSLAIYLIGLVDLAWPLWDSMRQALHDKLAGTYVVRK